MQQMKGISLMDDVATTLTEPAGVEVADEKAEFIARYELEGAINIACELISELFPDFEIKTALDIEFEELTKYTYLDIQMKPLVEIETSDIETLVDKYEELQIKFHERVERKHTSKMLFSMDFH
ncbi:hypothetical protein MBAV_003140 [Candidatus Magnetobacterium bavaricum]|uniref:Uncharacterized protein n=1 Tax=Candidatus Magnetobacterium bavaricum TaxID=29290 RepID=A0A0F3GRY6_9BACT|nr:hypothetical protein MBAV_003140 [Candidatus Magnetobacterium bavaricum]